MIMAPISPQFFLKKTELAQDSQPSLPRPGFLVAGGTLPFLILLTFLCNHCRRNNKEKRIKTEGVKLTIGCTPQLRPVNTPETGVCDPNPMHCNGEYGLRSWPVNVDYLRLLGTELSEEGEKEDPGNPMEQQNRELPNIPGNNFTGGKLVNLRKLHDMINVYSQVKGNQNNNEDSLYESVGTNYEHNPADRQYDPRYWANGTPRAILTQSQQSLEPAINTDTPEYASIRKAKKKENNLEEKPLRRNVKNGCVLLPGTRNHGEELRIKDSYAPFSQTENFCSRIQGGLKPITGPEAKISMEEFEEEGNACGSFIEEQLYTNNASIQGESCYCNKSHEKIHSMTDAEIAGLYSKVAKKAIREELPLNIEFQREDHLKFYSWSTGNINEEESDYESIKSPCWHTGSQILGEKSYAPDNERMRQMKFQNDDEEAEPGYEAINTKWNKMDFPFGRKKAQKIARERQTENYYESINELQQSCAFT
ncbi:uncharacterized protein [Narcine bancroftii]|uniref:uncharacterized protein isoform X2 n=1 Tax=Narcine bancroftii TaxID=1343680 RepID=UPI0038318B56